MGFRLSIQADYGGEILDDVHPEGKPSGGKAVMAFLMGLLSYCDWKDDSRPQEERDMYHEWYAEFEHLAGVELCPACKPILDCMWGDGGDPTEFREDEFEFFLHRKPGSTEEDFRHFLRASSDRWSPIEEVARGVRVLLDIFSRAPLKPIDGSYVPEDTIPDFEALAANLDFLIKRGHEMIRLNFN